jgi:hypothetical protein
MRNTPMVRWRTAYGPRWSIGVFCVNHLAYLR